MGDENRNPIAEMFDDHPYIFSYMVCSVVGSICTAIVRLIRGYPPISNTDNDSE